MVPSWDHLCRTAMAQGGYFTTAQAEEAGYSTVLLQYHLGQGHIERMRRGIYRLVHYPLGDHDDLIVAWLWSKREGVLSHSTALALHELSDVLPSKKHLTLPVSWHRRRVLIPPGMALHYWLPPEEDRTWYDCLPVTTPLRTLLDCQAAHLLPDLLEQARQEGVARGLFSQNQIEAASVESAVTS